MKRCRPSPVLRAAAWLVAGWLALVSASAGAAPRWSLLTEIGFQHLTLDQGLPHQIATAVAEDGAGFLWVGTNGGIARWDGYRFHVYRGDPRTPGAFPDNIVQALHQDAAGRLWIGTSAAGLVRYDAASDRFVGLSAGREGLSHVSVRSIADDGAGGLWVGTDGGLDHVDARGGGVRRGTTGLEGQRVNVLLRDRSGRLWAGTPDGLFCRPAGGGPFQALQWPDGDAAEPQSLLEDSGGRLWVGTARHGAFVVEPGSKQALALAESTAGSGPPLAIQQISSLVEARPGEVWLGTAARGIVAVDVATRQTRRIRHRPTLPLSLPDNAVRDLHRDRAGLVWVATNRGLSRHDPRQTAVLTMFGAPQSEGGPDDTPPAGIEVSWIQPAADGRLWLGTLKNGIEIVDPSGARSAALRPDASRPDSALPQDSVLAMERAGDGSVHVGTRRGLYHVSADARRVTRVPLTGRDPAAPTSAVHADGALLWVGGMTDGLWRLDVASGRAERHPRTAQAAFSDQRVTVIGRADAGRLWVGTRFGLNRYDPGNGSVLAIVPEPGRADGLSAGFVTTLYVDKRQRLWVGTYGGGISILEGFGADGQPRFVHLGSLQGLPDDNVNALLEDRNGTVWVSTDNGLAVVDPLTLAVRSLRRAEGVVFSTYWTGAAARTAEGELLFGGAGGMTIVRPDRVEPWTYQPPVLVTDLRVGGEPLPAGPHSVANAPPVVVPAGANSLTVEFAAADFSAPGRNRYAYRLEGFDKGWTEVDASRRLAAYTNLPPGSYRLHLRGSNRDGAWSPRETTLAVRVLPAWHQTPWARIGALVAVLLAVALIVRWRTRLLRRQQAELERKVGERTAELEAVSRALEEKTRVLELTSISDPLTGLRNRRFLSEHIDSEIAASLRRALDAGAAGPPATVDTDTVFLLIDADHFKRVNDLHGHAAGDDVLVQFAERLQSALRESDHLVRWGGEEFLAVARDTDRARAEELAERIRCSIAERPFELDSGHRIEMTASIGFACLPFLPQLPRAVGWQDVVQLADLALLAAKRAGRDGWVGLHAGSAAQPENLRGRVEAAPRQALADGEIRLSSSRAMPAVLEALGAPPPAGAPDQPPARLAW